MTDSDLFDFHFVVVGHILGGSINDSVFNGENKYFDGIGTYNSEIVESEKGVVAADDGRCSEIGASVLRKGGHAVDAAVATALCLGVVCSMWSGIGGGGFMVVRSASTLQAIAIDFRETAPLAASQVQYLSFDKTDGFLLASNTFGSNSQVVLCVKDEGGGSVQWKRESEKL